MRHLETSHLDMGIVMPVAFEEIKNTVLGTAKCHLRPHQLTNLDNTGFDLITFVPSF